MNFSEFSRAARTAYYLVFSVFTLLVACIIIWLLMSSLKSTEQIFTDPLGIPTNPTLSNFSQAWVNGNFGREYLNSTFITTSSVAGILLFESLAGYAFARLEFRGKTVLFWIFLIGQAVPSQMVVLPAFLEASKLHLIDSDLGLVLQYISWAPFALLFFRASFLAIPREIEEAAMIDGASRWRVLFRIIFPNAKPAFASVAVIYGLWFWTDFLFPVAYLRTPSNFTVTLGLTTFVGAFTTYWGQLMAGVLIVSVPPVLFFLAVRRSLESGFARGSLNI